jgi:hypothetical protein
MIGATIWQPSVMQRSDPRVRAPHARRNRERAQRRRISACNHANTMRAWAVSSACPSSCRIDSSAAAGRGVRPHPATSAPHRSPSVCAARAAAAMRPLHRSVAPARGVCPFAATHAASTSRSPGIARKRCHALRVSTIICNASSGCGSSAVQARNVCVKRYATGGSLTARFHSADSTCELFGDGVRNIRRRNDVHRHGSPRMACRDGNGWQSRSDIVLRIGVYGGPWRCGKVPNARDPSRIIKR